MLHLLRSPAWITPQAHTPLPVTVPAALLVVLGAHAAWMGREQLALIFWPDASPADALHHVRINLHRARSLLKQWGMNDALQAERTRVQLLLPTDLMPLRAVQRDGDAAAVARLCPTDWLQGFNLAGYDGFLQWSDQIALRLQTDWLAANRLDRTQDTAAAHEAPPGRETAWQALLSSAAPALVLLGEPGAGKTTLLHAAWPQAPCLRGLEGLHTMPYRPLLVTLRERLALLQRALREPGHPLRPYRLDLARMLPELAIDEALPPLDALTARSRLVEALTRAFEALSPVLLVDDLQWCDATTVEWLLMLAQTGRLRWRAAARRHEITPELTHTLSLLRHAARLHEIDLAALDDGAIARLCRRSFPGQPFSDERLARLGAWSGGNALLLVELVRHDLGDGDTHALPPTIQDAVAHLVRDRLQRLSPAVRRAVEAASVFVQPVPRATLFSAPDAAPPDDLSAGEACERAVDAGLLRRVGALLACRHDLIRSAVERTLPDARRRQLHRHAALWLATDSLADALTIAAHWRAAGEPQTALAWRHQGAEQLKARGRFEMACELWREVADASLDASQALRARLELAACELFGDLARGAAALTALQVQLPAVADAKQRAQLEGRVRAAWVDNRVFAGDLAGAAAHALRLRELLPELPPHEQPWAIEPLLELAMREPDIPRAWALLGQLRSLSPRLPTLLSFEGQIHWFGGEVQAAHDALDRLLALHPEHCRGITVENDLAVMLQALGRIAEAEAMARRSLQSWAGVAHTETLSLLVLGSTLTSAGRHDEAEAALQRALALALSQGSPGFEAEARVRRARLLLQCDDAAAAQRELDIAAPLLQHSPEPLRVSQLAAAQVQVAVAAAKPVPEAPWRRLQALVARSQHPLVHARLARAGFAVAVADGHVDAAIEAARRQAALARAAGLLEVLAEARWLEAQALRSGGVAEPNWLPLAQEALALAQRQGFGALRAQIQRSSMGTTNCGAPSCLLCSVGSVILASSG